MNAGIDILLARMKTHPEEFYRSSRWTSLYQDFHLWFTDEEKLAFEMGIAECRQTEFNEIVMTRLTGELEEDKEAMGKLKQKYQPPQFSPSQYQQATQLSQLSQLSQYQQAQNSVLNQLDNIQGVGTIALGNTEMGKIYK